jgi:hypothetical protein
MALAGGHSAKKGGSFRRIGLALAVSPPVPEQAARSRPGRGVSLLGLGTLPIGCPEPGGGRKYHDETRAERAGVVGRHGE